MELSPLRKELEEKNNNLKKMYDEAKEIKLKRDQANENVKKYKKERDEINKIVNEKISEIKKIKEERAKLIEEFKQLKIGKNIIQKRIEELEYKIETQSLSIDKERALVSEVEYYMQLQKKSTYLDELTNTINLKSKEISELIDKSSEKHKLVLEYSKNSSKYHNELMKQYDKITKAKKEADEFYKMIKEKRANNNNSGDKNTNNKIESN